jgi:hypothetical protein
MNDKTCRNCRWFKQLYHEIGRCTKQESPNSFAKMFAEDGKTGILVHISFGCLQWEAQPSISSETL